MALLVVILVVLLIGGLFLPDRWERRLCICAVVAILLAVAALTLNDHYNGPGTHPSVLTNPA